MTRLRPDRPNIVVFFTDQQRWDSVGLHGNPLELTPNLDRMARRGTHVPNAFTPQPVCAPTRACMQTGLYSTTSGIYRNHLPVPAEMQGRSQAVPEPVSWNSTSQVPLWLTAG